MNPFLIIIHNQILENNCGSDEGLREVFTYIQEETMQLLDHKDGYVVVKSDLNIHTRLLKVCSSGLYSSVTWLTYVIYM